MPDLSPKDSSSVTKIVGHDEAHCADVVLDGGIRKLQTNASVTVEELFGEDPLPDTYFTITNAGASGNTIRVQIAATAKDSSAPDRDFAAVDVTSTLTGSQAGDEIATAQLVVDDLNANATFAANLLKAVLINSGRRAIVHITADFDESAFGLSGEFIERPNVGDVQVTTTGTTTVSLAFDTLISRGKPTSLARDPDNPHRLGVLGISGSVTSLPGTIDNLFETFALNGGSNDLRVNGSLGSPVTFTVNSDPDEDIIITTMRFAATAGGSIKFRNFLAGNVALTNGVRVIITANNGKVTTLQDIKTTEQFLNRFSSGPSFFSVDSLPSGDNATGWFQPLGSVVLKKGTADKIEVLIRDNISGATFADVFNFFVRGFKK